MSGLILGYGTATLPQVRRAAAELAVLITGGGTHQQGLFKLSHFGQIRQMRY